MGKSNDQCHFCKNEIESLMHMFYSCHTIKHVLHELKHVFKIILENNIVLVEENLIIGMYKGEITEYLLLVNLVMCILKWKYEIT
jgi:cephalosporin hydroxylase